MKLHGVSARAGTALVVLVLFMAMAAAGEAAVSDTEGQTTLEQRIVPAASGSYRFLQLGEGEPYTVREELAAADPERAEKRTSLAYFGQLSDFQLADEESPARLEIIDPLSTPLNLPFGAAWRPWEALEPQIDDSMIRQIDQFTAASPIANGNGSHSPMNFTIDTGDSADNQQLNETEWVRTLLEGGTLNPNSGVDKSKYSNPLCPNLLVPGAALNRRGTNGSRHVPLQQDGIFEGSLFPVERAPVRLIDDVLQRFERFAAVTDEQLGLVAGEIEARPVRGLFDLHGGSDAERRRHAIEKLDDRYAGHMVS